MNIAIIGAGNVGTALGARCMASGNAVCYGVRSLESESVKKAQALQSNAQFKLIPEAVQWADSIILCTPGHHEYGAGYKADAQSLGDGAVGKVIIDTTNPLSGWPTLESRWDGSPSAGEELQELLPKSYVAKAFNTIGREHMEQPDGAAIEGKQLTMMFACNPEGKDLAAKVIAAVGFSPEYIGPIRYARNLEAIAELWIHQGVPGCGFGAPSRGRNFHFQLIQKK